jgi:hypothetical protein
MHLVVVSTSKLRLVLLFIKWILSEIDSALGNVTQVAGAWLASCPMIAPRVADFF